MGTRYLLALFLILLVVGFAAQGTPTPQPNKAASTSLFSHMQKSLLEYWCSAKNTAQNLLQKTQNYLPSMDEKIRDMYNKSTVAATTYAGIFTDQIFHMLKGEE